MTKSSQEANFSFDELFYSKTDKKGIIMTGNSVFQRVSEYAWENLLHRPHNVIRHPDMPKGVFHLFWEYLKADKPIGAFVKNQSKSGKYYWVFALAMPVSDGYLSVRIKPGGELLAIIEKEYSALRTKELSEKISPKDSQEFLLQRISALGFSDYTSFMTYALSNQIENRCRELKIAVPTTLDLMKEMRSASGSLLEDTVKILSVYDKTKFVPLNLEIHSARFGQEGRQLSVVASQYQKMVEEINREIERFSSMSKTVIEKIEMGQFYTGASQLMEDVNRFIKNEEAANEASNEENNEGAKELSQLSDFYLKSSVDGVKEIIEVLNRFKRICETLQSMGAALELVRITGKVETARLSQASDIGKMLHDLRDFQSTMSMNLKKILDSQSVMSNHAKALMNMK